MDIADADDRDDKYDLCILVASRSDVIPRSALLFAPQPKAADAVSNKFPIKMCLQFILTCTRIVWKQPINRSAHISKSWVPIQSNPMGDIVGPWFSTASILQSTYVHIVETVCSWVIWAWKWWWWWWCRLCRVIIKCCVRRELDDKWWNQLQAVGRQLFEQYNGSAGSPPPPPCIFIAILHRRRCPTEYSSLSLLNSP